MQTNRFEFKTNRFQFSAVHNIHFPFVIEAIKNVGVPLKYCYENVVLWLPKEEAIKITFE